MALDRELVGRSYPPSAVYEVGREKIAEFAAALGDPDPVYLDPEAARSAGHPDVIAPPTFAIVLSLGAGGRLVEVHRVGVAQGGRELGDLLAPDLVHGRGRVAAPDQSCVQRHAPALSPRDRWGQRVSRWTVCRRSVGQYFLSSIRSGSFRRFLRVM